VVAFMVGREVTVILVIALLVAGGSQLPKLVRSLGSSTVAPNRRSTDDDPEPDAPEPGVDRGSPGP